MAWNAGGGAYRSSLTNCALNGNSASGTGGGVSVGTLCNCTLTGNRAYGGNGGGAAGSTLYNCTLNGNLAVLDAPYGGSGGGVSSSTLYNCTLIGNWAPYGGGAFGGTVYNCTLMGNQANLVFWGYLTFGGSGGGAAQSTLYNCTLTSNSADEEFGGVWGGTLYNSIVYYNTASDGANYDSGSTLNHCCTTPLPTSGGGNIPNAPLFIDYTHGNLRLQPISSCIHAGNNAYVTTVTDLDGRPRVVGGTVDMGAYEFQGPFNQWLQSYGLPTDGSADFIDSDGDGLNNWQEWVCATDPTNALSVLRLLSATPAGTTVTVNWCSVAGVNYFLERSSNLDSPFAVRATNILGQGIATSYSDTNITDTGPFFYRVGVRSR